MFTLAQYLERNRSIYYDRLLGISKDDDWNGWVSFFLQAITEQAEENSQKAISILELYKEMKVTIPDIVSSKYSVRVIDGIFSKPIFKSTELYSLTGDNKMAAGRILGPLLEKGILTVMKEAKGRQPAVYAFSRLLEITEKCDIVLI